MLAVLTLNLAFRAGNERPADDSEPELLQGADPEGDVDPFNLEEPLRQTLPILLQSQEQQQRAHTAATAAKATCRPSVSPFIHIKVEE